MRSDAYFTRLAVFALPGYTLKGIEKELSRHRLPPLQAEIYLIRLRQAWAEYKTSDDEARAEVVEKWKVVVREVEKH
jgi:sterol 3beta-glucosyltransferase